MAFAHGKSTGVYIAEFDLSQYFGNANGRRGVTLGPTPTFGNDDMKYVAGLENGTIDLAGFWDGTADAVDEELAESITQDQAMSVAPAGFGTLGNQCYIGNAHRTEYSIDGSVTDAVAVSASTTITGGLRTGARVLHVPAARTATFNGTSIDDSASSAYGAVAHLHVTAFTGTSVDIRVQDSTDDAVFVDLISFAATSAVGGYRGTATGTVNRYLRVAIDGGTFTSVTFLVTVARNRR